MQGALHREFCFTKTTTPRYLKRFHNESSFLFMSTIIFLRFRMLVSPTQAEVKLLCRRQVLPGVPYLLDTVQVI